MSKAFEAGGADAVMIETQLDLEEASIAVRAAKENTGLVVMATMPFDKGPRGFFTMFGNTPESAVIGLQGAGADIVGTNCGSGIERMVEFMAEHYRKLADLPVNVLGGCCGTTADHIRALVQSVKGELATA